MICRILVHILVLVVAYGYMVLGGYWFCLIEGWQSDAPVENVTEKVARLKKNMTNDLLTFSVPLPTEEEWSAKVQHKLDAYVHDVNEAAKHKGSGWNLLDGFLYAFSTVTTIGYGHLTTESDAGRVFYVFYGLLGIPLFTLAMADIGLFLEKFMNWIYVMVLQCCSTKLSMCRSWRTRKRLVPAESLLALPVVLFLFLAYTALGGVLFPLWENQWGFVKAFYVAFDTITTIGIGDIYPLNNDWFMATLIYESVGIAIACMAIGALSDYIRVIHHFGTDPTDCGMEVIWFGGRHMRVSEFVRVVGKELGSTDCEIKTVQNSLDRIVNEVFIERRQSRGRNSFISSHEPYPGSGSPLKLVNYGVQPQPSLYRQDDDLLKDNPDNVNNFK